MPSLIPSIWLPRPLTFECCCQFTQPFAHLACAVGARVSFVQINEMSPPRAVTDLYSAWQQASHQRPVQVPHMDGASADTGLSNLLNSVQLPLSGRP